VDPATGLEHKKGDKKIDPVTGTYYYETLGGRTPYGKEVLSGWDTITRDGTTLNKFDPFDSDDLDKSFAGSAVKSILKVAPALIPGISPWYIGARVGLSTLDLMGKLGKMVVGSESPTLSYLEALNDSFTMSQSDWAQGSAESQTDPHMWSVESILNLGADVFTQLAEQRWVFQNVPKWIRGGKDPFSKEGRKAIISEYEFTEKEAYDRVINSDKVASIFKMANRNGLDFQ